MGIIAQAFDVQEHYRGVLHAGSREVANARVDLKYNSFDPKEIIAEFTDIDWFEFEIPPRQTLPNEDAVNLVFECKGEGISLELRERNLGRFTNEIICHVSRYERSTRHAYPVKDDCSPVPKSSSHYFFPLRGLTLYEGADPMGGNRGCYGGYLNSVDGTEIEWRNEETEITLPALHAYYYDSMIYKKCESDEDYLATVIGRRAGLVIDKIDGKDVFEQSETMTFSKAFFDILSLMEQESVDWHTVQHSTLAQESLETTIIRPNGMRDDRYLTQSRAYRYQRELRALFPSFLEAYFGLTDDKKIVFDNVMHSYRIAARAKTIESSLVYYHSCLDLLRKHFVFKKTWFTDQLLKACEGRVEVADLQFRMTKKNGYEIFRFTEIRNKFLHDDFHIDDDREVIGETRKMRALTERLILALLGVDYRTTRLGYPSV